MLCHYTTSLCKFSDGLLEESYMFSKIQGLSLELFKMPKVDKKTRL